MLDQINKAFAELDDKMHVSAIEFVKEKKKLIGLNFMMQSVKEFLIK